MIGIIVLEQYKYYETWLATIIIIIKINLCFKIITNFMFLCQKINYSLARRIKFKSIILYLEEKIKNKKT